MRCHVLHDFFTQWVPGVFCGSALCAEEAGGTGQGKGGTGKTFVTVLQGMGIDAAKGLRLWRGSLMSASVAALYPLTGF